MHSIHFFFLFWGWGLLDFLVSNVFPSSSQWVSQHGSQVPNVFPNIFSRAPHCVPYALPRVLEPILVRENWDLDVCMFGVKYFYNGESPKFQNFFCDGPIKKGN
jgi:hypothetical protein